MEQNLNNFIQNWKKYLTESISRDSAHAILIKDGKILIVRRSHNDPWMPHHYAFPGGNIENGENTVEGLCRECAEEIGLSIKPENCKFLSDISSKLRHKFYLITQFDGNLRLNNEHDDFKWVNPKELSNFKTVPDLITVVSAVLQQI